MSVGERGRGDAGVTMIEILVTIVIMGLIAAPLASAFRAVTHNSDSLNTRLLKSHDAQLVANYIVTDAQSTSGTQVSLSDTTTCSPGAGVTPVVRFTWSAVNSGGTNVTKNVNYVRSGSTVTRWACDTSGTTNTPVGHSVASTTAACTPAPCNGTAKGVTVNVTETQDANESSAYQYTLSGTFRQVPANGVPSSPPTGSFPILTLATTGNALTTGPNGHITVNGGTLVVNSTSSCPVSGNFVPANTPIDGAGPVGNCGSNYHQTGGAADPYQGLQPPTVDKTHPQSSDCSQTLQPGYYASGFGGNRTCTLASGVYYVDGDISFHGNGKLIASSGVFIYINGGSFSTGGNGASTIAPMSTGPYAGIVIFQARGDSNPLSIGGNGFTDTIGGLIYAPSASVSLNGNNSGATALSIIALSVNTGNGDITVG